MRSGEESNVQRTIMAMNAKHGNLSGRGPYMRLTFTILIVLSKADRECMRGSTASYARYTETSGGN